MKKFLSLALILALCFGMILPVLGADAASGDFTIDKNGTLTKYNGPGGHVVIPEGVKSVGGFYNALHCSASPSRTALPASGLRPFPGAPR